jgi:hypothetical protein
MRLPADHDEVAGEVAEQMSFWTCASFAAPATLRRMFQYMESWSVLHMVLMSVCPTPMSLQLFSRALP